MSPNRGPEFDVAVVGASIAGCTAATLFARRGARVALIERQPDIAAYKRICTHIIHPSALPTLRRTGLIEPIEAAGGVQSTFDVWRRWGWIRPREDDARERHVYAFNMRRELLDPMLRRLAAEPDAKAVAPGSVPASGRGSLADRRLRAQVPGLDTAVVA